MPRVLPIYPGLLALCGLNKGCEESKNYRNLDPLIPIGAV